MTPNGDNTEDDTIDTNIVSQAGLITSNELVLPDSENGRDRYITIEKRSPETISPLVKRDVSLDGIYEVVDRNFSYPLTAHVGLKFDSRTFSSIPERQYDVKMKKVKVPSNYFPLGGNGLDRRYVFANPDYPANPNTLDVIFMVDQNMNERSRKLLRRNLKEFIFKLVSGYTNVRFSIWQTAANNTNFIVNEATKETINNFTYYSSSNFSEMETPDSTGANQTNLIKLLDDALAASPLSPTVDPSETSIANFFFRKTQFSITDEVGKSGEEAVTEKLWVNTVRKVIYFSGHIPEVMAPETYQISLNRAREAGIQFYYLHADPDFSGTRTLRELAEDTGGAKFNLASDSDIKLQQFCDRNFYDSNKIYYGDWDGTFKLAWTDNPAWILYDIVTDYNYGLGNYIDNSSIDKWTLYDIGRYCDAVDDDGRFRGVPDGKGGLEPRYTCNIIYYNKDEAYNILKDVAAIFKGIIYWNTEGFSFFADKKKDPIIYFANVNVKDGAFVYTETAKNKRYTSVEITYNDKYDDFKTKVEFIEDVDGIRNFGLNPFKVNAAGCTSRSEARRIGRYIICSSMFESDTVTFTAGLEGAYLQPGDIFGVSDEVRNVGRSFGRILEIDENAKTIKIDGEFHPDLASGIYIHVPSGNFSVSDLNSLTGSDGGFTGTLEQIRARRQRQTRKFNLHTVVDNSYGATLTLTGDFLLQSVVTDVYPVEGRISGASYTGQTILTGEVYYFPEHTVATGNPKWDSLTFSNVSGVLSDLEIDINFSGIDGTGQVIGSEPNWTCYISGSNGIVNVDGVQRGTTASNLTAIALNSAGAFVAQSSTSASLADIGSFIEGRNNGEVIVIVSNGSPIAWQTAVPSVFASYAATEIYKLGADSATAGSYLAALIKNDTSANNSNYRILERASKTSNDTGSLVFTYRDLLAFTRLRPYYTFVQADFGNRAESNYEEWQSGREYAVGNIIKYNSETYICTKAHTKSALAFTSDFIDGNAAQSKWSKGNSLGYYTVGMPKGFYGSEKIYTNSALTSTHVSNAFNALGLNVYVGGGTLGQSDLRLLAQENGIGYSGLIYGTGYEKGFYNLTVDTTPKNLDLISEGSLYVLSGSGIEPKLYKTIATKEEEANQYSVVGIEYLRDKEEFIEKDMMDTSPSYYVQGPYDVVVKPNPPSGIVSVSGYGGTGVHIIWSGTSSPIVGYKVYVSRPDYSTLGDEYDSITDAYTVASGITTLTVPISGAYGQYDFDVYSQGVLYKLLSIDAAQTGAIILPSATLTGQGGYTITSTIPSGFTIDTADKNSVNYQIAHLGGGLYAGAGVGNFTSADVTFRWKYIDPTGGVMSTKEQILENPFVDLPQKVTVQILDNAGQILKQEENYQGLSYTVTQKMNGELFSRETESAKNVEYSRSLGLRVIVQDNTNLTKTGTFYAHNQYPYYNKIQVIDSYQNSPYYVLSGYYGHSTFTGIALWNPENNTTTGTISGSGVRDLNGELIRSEDDSVPLTFRDISGAFLTATGYNGTGITSTAERAGVGINYKGTGEADYEAYVYAYEDLIKYYNDNVDKATSIEDWGLEHFTAYGSGEGRKVPSTKGNPLGIANLETITAANTTGFSGISFTVLPEDVSKGQIIFNCYNTTSNKDVYSVDVYTGQGFPEIIDHTGMANGNWYEIMNVGSSVNWKAIGCPSQTPIIGTEFEYNGTAINGSDAQVKRVFEADIVDHTNQFNYVNLDKTRSYVNTIRLAEGLETGKWHYFRFRPWDDFGPGDISNVVSGYLEIEPVERINPVANRFEVDGGRNEDQDSFNIHTNSLVNGANYQIDALGSSVNWTAIGAESATIGVKFTYNGTTIIGSGGKAKRIESEYELPEDKLNSINLITPRTDSSIVMPADVAEGNSVVIVNRGSSHNLHILDAEGNEISIIRPNERAEIFRDQTEWLDSRGSILSLE